MMALSKIRLGCLLIMLLGVLYADGYFDEAREYKYSRARSEIAGLRTELKRYQSDNGRYPTSDEGLGSLFKNADLDSAIVRGVAAAPAPRDPWGNPYFYESDGIDYVLGSLGPHGTGEEPDPELPLESN